MPAPASKISAAHVAGLSQQDTAGYWWFAVRHDYVRQMLRRVARRAPLRYLDFGCGTGGTLAAVLAEHAPEHALGIDGTAAAVAIAAARGLPVRCADVLEPVAPGFAPNAVTCLDVLEHLADPVAALRHLAAVVAPQAELLVTVPAMPMLHSRWDDLCGHHRRYTRGLLAEHLRAGGFAPRRIRAAFSYAVVPALVQRRLLRRVQEFEFPPVSAPINWLLRTAGRLERWLGNPVPFGTSLVATAQREGA